MGIEFTGIFLCYVDSYDNFKHYYRLVWADWIGSFFFSIIAFFFLYLPTLSEVAHYEIISPVVVEVPPMSTHRNFWFWLAFIISINITASPSIYRISMIDHLCASFCIGRLIFVVFFVRFACNSPDSIRSVELSCLIRRICRILICQVEMWGWTSLCWLRDFRLIRELCWIMSFMFCWCERSQVRWPVLSRNVDV